MSYQVLARKWRPQRFRRRARPAGGHAHAVERAEERPHRARVRVRRPARLRQDDDGAHPGASAQLRERARPPEPCGVCDACIEIAEGRDIDVLEIDAATHTGVDNVREVIIEGLSIAPGAQPLQGLPHRRGAHAVLVVVQRAAEVDRRAAAARRLHDGDDRAAEDSRHGPLALAGLRVPDHRRADRRRAAALHRHRRVD